MKLRCLVVDDEPVARKGIAEYISEIDFLELKGQCESALAANKILTQEEIDLVFLDIQMPGLTGLGLLRSLKKPPLAILITAYPEYAVDGFELDVLDYLLKPVSFERFLKACNKARDLFSLQLNQSPEKSPPEFFFVKAGNKIEKVELPEIRFVKALQNYVEIHLADRRLITYLPFKNIEAFLPADQFVKVHKSWIVPLNRIDSIEGNMITIGAQQIPVSRQLKEKVMELVTKGKFLKR